MKRVERSPTVQLRAIVHEVERIYGRVLTEAEVERVWFVLLALRDDPRQVEMDFTPRSESDLNSLS